MADPAQVNGTHRPWAPPPAGPVRQLRPVAPYVPFPTHALPGPLRPFARAAAISIGCDEAFVGIPALAAAAAAIGNTRRIAPKRLWTEPPVIWAALIGESGTRKSPPFRAALRPLVAAEQRYREEYGRAAKRYAELPDNTSEPRPVCRRLVTEDVTIESVALILVDNPRGIINARDEIDDWFQSLTRYKGKAGGTDRARWLKLSNADTLLVDRKTGDPAERNIMVPRASCCIAGTIQPAILAASLDRLARQSGLAARLLLAKPDYRSQPWTDAEVDPPAEEGYVAAVEALLALTPTADGSGRPKPHTLHLAADAKAEWVPWYNALQHRKAEAASERRAVLAKLEGYALRFALVHHVTEEAAAGRDAIGLVSVGAMRAGMCLAEWFGGEADRIYAVLDETDDEQAARELAEWVRGRGGRCAPRDLQKARGGSFPTAEAAEGALDVLVQLGCGRWEEEPNPRGGWVRRRFVLSPRENASDTCDTRPEPGADDGAGDSDT